MLQARYQWVLSMVKLKLLCGESHTGVMEQVNAFGSDLHAVLLGSAKK